MILLKLVDVAKSFGGLQAIKGLNFEVNQGDMLGLIGPNGSGKTTCFHLICGIHNVTSGDIFLKDVNITNYKPNEVASAGIGRTFQLINLVGSLSVLENVLLAGLNLKRLGFWNSLVPTRSIKTREMQLRERGKELLEKFGIYHVRNEIARNIPLGYQRILSIACALATEPEILLLDEPVSGLSVSETTEIMSIIEKLSTQNISILLVEHNMNIVMNYCNRIVAINFGEKIAEGSPLEIKENQAVIDSYLGKA